MTFANPSTISCVWRASSREGQTTRPTGPSPAAMGMRSSSCSDAITMGSANTIVLPAWGWEWGWVCVCVGVCVGGGGRSPAALLRAGLLAGCPLPAAATAPLAPGASPDPVNAMPMMSRPDRMTGRPCIWMGVGFLMPFSSRCCRMAGGNFMSANEGMGGGRLVPSQMM